MTFIQTTIMVPLILIVTGVLLLPLVNGEEISTNRINMMIGDTTTGHVSSHISTTISINITNYTDKAIRITATSSDANLSFPLFISVRQERHISSLTLPYTEGGHSYSQVSRTLCPLLNAVPLYTSSPSLLHIDISTPTHFNVSYNISALIVTDYNLRLNTPLVTSISSSSPVVHVYEYPVGIDRVLVKVTSQSLTCALVSVQHDLCPIDQLLDTADHRGDYQTMQQLAAINVKRPTHQNIIYIVITLYHHGDCTDTNYNFIDGLITLNKSANYDPVGIHDDDILNKTITIEIGHTLTSTQYAVAMVALVLLMSVVMISGCVWILVDELCCYRCHSSKEFLMSLQPTEDTDRGIEDTDRGIERKKWLSWLLNLIIGRQWLHEIETSFAKGTENKYLIEGPHLLQQEINIQEVNEQEMIQQEMNDDIIEEVDSGEGDVDCSSLLQRRHSYEMAVFDQETHSHTVPRTRSHTVQSHYPKYISELRFPEGREFQQQYSGYCYYLLVVVILYSLPVYQLVLTYQRFLTVTGNGDFCYYNSLCSHPLLGLSAFNNIWSNIGFFILGILFIIIAKRRRQRYRFYEYINKYYDSHERADEKLGVPQYFGVYYAAGIALMGESVMSAAYHVCPTGNNYQFDTTMMFVLVTLGLYQLFKCRNPDITPSPHNLLLILALLILVIGLGVLYTGLIFYIIFFCIFEVGVLYTSVQIYYRWRIEVSHVIPRLKICCAYICKFISRSLPCCVCRLVSNWEMVARINTSSPTQTAVLIFMSVWPPRDKVQFSYLIVSNIINIISAIVLVVSQPTDFATSFLAVMIINLMLSLSFHLLIKIQYHCYDCGRWKALIKPVLYLIISIVFWIFGLIFYQRAVTDWLKSPAGSRNSNKECLILNFYDSHDLWHICSGFGIFFAFLLLMTIEDHVELKKRTEIRIY